MRLATRARLVAIVGAAGLAVAACGGSGHSTQASADQTIEIEMRDTAYSPDRVSVKAGENVRFTFRNTGKLKHDAFVGDEQAQTNHESEMSEQSEKPDDHHGDPGAVTVEPGDTGSLTHTFTAGDDVLIGCHEPGHYDAGMKLTVDVT